MVRRNGRAGEKREGAHRPQRLESTLMCRLCCPCASARVEGTSQILDAQFMACALSHTSADVLQAARIQGLSLATSWPSGLKR